MKKTAPPKLAKFPAAKPRRLDQLLEKNSAGTITDREKAKLQQLLTEAEELMVTNARRLADFSQRGTAGVPANAVPVTFWVQPQMEPGPRKGLTEGLPRLQVIVVVG
jgi:hypothetical protein